MNAEQWTTAFGPFSKDGNPVDVDRLATTEAIRAGRPAHAMFEIRTGAGAMQLDRGERVSDRRLRRRLLGRDGPLLARSRSETGPAQERLMRLKVWGARGSVPAPGPHMNRYGGNTSCVSSPSPEARP